MLWVLIVALLKNKYTNNMFLLRNEENTKELSTYSPLTSLLWRGNNTIFN